MTRRPPQKPGTPQNPATHRQEAGLAALLDASADGAQAQQGVGHVRGALLSLALCKVQHGQRLAQRLQLVCPAQVG